MVKLTNDGTDWFIELNTESDHLNYKGDLKSINSNKICVINVIKFIQDNFNNANDILLEHENVLGFVDGPINKTRFIKTTPNALIPTKATPGDSGFDLTLIGIHKQISNSVFLYRTGIKLQPQSGYYFDLVPRSSIIKHGYMLANSIGIIDQGYTGEIYVPLIKINENAKDLELPIRLVQLIPRKIIHTTLEEVTAFEDTIRENGGFGSSN